MYGTPSWHWCTVAAGAVQASDLTRHHTVNVECAGFNGRDQINRVVTHPTLPLTVTAHEDHHLRFFDNNTGMSAFCISHMA